MYEYLRKIIKWNIFGVQAVRKGCNVKEIFIHPANQWQTHRYLCVKSGEKLGVNWMNFRFWFYRRFLVVVVVAGICIHPLISFRKYYNIASDWIPLFLMSASSILCDRFSNPRRKFLLNLMKKKKCVDFWRKLNSFSCSPFWIHNCIIIVVDLPCIVSNWSSGINYKAIRWMCSTRGNFIWK